MRLKTCLNLAASMVSAALLCYGINNYTTAPDAGIVELFVFQISCFIFLDAAEGPHKGSNP